MRKKTWYGMVILLMSVFVFGCSPAFKTNSWQANDNLREASVQVPTQASVPSAQEEDTVTSIVIAENGWIWYGGYENYDQVKIYAKPSIKRPVKTVFCELVENQNGWHILRFKLPADRHYSCFNFYNSKTDSWHMIMPGSEACITKDSVFITDSWRNRNGESQGNCYAVEERFNQKQKH